MADNENLKTLIEMGFSEVKCRRAVELNSNLNDAMEWILAHMDEPDSAFEQPKQSAQLHLKTPENTTNESSTPIDNATAEVAASAGHENKEDTEAGQAHSLKCDDCGKLLKDSDAATAHAYKTNHSNFSESTETIKPKTKEEIEEQKRQLAEKLVKMRAEKAEKEKQDEIEREKLRRKQGRELHDLRQKIQEDELKRIAEEKRREKLAAEAAKQRVKEQIVKDREQFKKQQQGGNDTTSPTAVPQPAAAAAPVIAEKRSYDECKIQIRLTNGKMMINTFKAKESLAAVRLWIELNRTDENTPFSILQPFPRKQFTDDDMMRTLEDLSLVPASSLIITRKV